ncbi:MAG: metabolite traffic protein EboE [Planctomycetota bacterium]|nr:metabolite traffic protein EboE [Planctomycetota bacterium]
MRFVHPSHGDAAVRLAYCTNLHAGETLPEIQQGLERHTVRVKEQLQESGPFGVGLYLPAKVALHLASAQGAGDLQGFAAWLEQAGLDPFTFNAFPYGGFQRDGLKVAVYDPTWDTTDRAAYTAAVAQVAPRLAGWSQEPSRHISISTHPGAHVSQVGTGVEIPACVSGLARAVVDLVMGQDDRGARIVLSVEAEPWAIAGDSAAMVRHLEAVSREAQELLIGGHGFSVEQARTAVGQNLGTCLDACHSAVEFEPAGDAVRLARRVGSMGKLQYSNALSLSRPGSNPEAVAALLALDEPRFLHQVNGGAQGKLVRASDLVDLQGDLAGADRSSWMDCEEWRCHFHVPVNLPEFAGLGTTQGHADAILLDLLEDPSAWNTTELHVEIETYTWNILPGSSPGGLVPGLVAEYRHVLDLLADRGWVRNDN